MKFALTRKQLVVFFCCIVISLFLLLSSYKAVISFTNLISPQQGVFLFLQDKGELVSGFTAEETSHLEDVRIVMKTIDYILYFLLLFISIVLIYYRKDKTFIREILLYGGISSVILTTLTLLSSLLLFNVVFTLFHQLFFPQGNWAFPADSLLIQTFPLEFFITISRNIFLLTLFLGILFILLGYYSKYVLRHRN